jgi:hypothetical protein
MDVWAISTADGANISQGTYNGGANQQFRFLSVGDGAYQVQPVHSGKAVDVEGISKNNGANVFQWTYFGTSNQQFIAVPTGDGYYKLVARHSGRIVEVANASTTNGANVQQWDNNNQPCGQWKLVSVATGTPARTASPNIEKTERAETATFGLYPNPVENTLYFSTSMKGAKVSVANLQTTEVLSETLVNENGLNVSALKPGLYFVIFIKDGNRIVKRFVKR